MNEKLTNGEFENESSGIISVRELSTQWHRTKYRFPKRDSIERKVFDSIEVNDPSLNNFL